MTTTIEQVQGLLGLAGISPAPTELDQLAAQFPAMRASIERLWALDLGDTAPSLVFRAAEATGPAEVAR
jgi:Asp-tRNA(Asn)/Glu-tRNA(Gln) amidotransferase C subunit